MKLCKHNSVPVHCHQCKNIVLTAEVERLNEAHLLQSQEVGKWHRLAIENRELAEKAEAEMGGLTVVNAEHFKVNSNLSAMAKETQAQNKVLREALTKLKAMYPTSKEMSQRNGHGWCRGFSDLAIDAVRIAEQALEATKGEG